jgi:hypothetical protein
MLVKGTIINLDMHSSDNASVFEEHVLASIKCMDTKSYDLKLPPSDDISLPLVRCIGDIYEAFQQKCNYSKSH